MNTPRFTDEQALAFIGPRGDYYLPRWRRIEAEGNLAVGFNWAAFFGGLAWLAYRRMFRAFWIAAGLCFAFGLVEQQVIDMAGLHPPPEFDSAVFLAINVTFGIFGTSWYYRYAHRIAAPLLADESTPLGRFRAAGGARQLNLWLCIAIAFALLVFLAWLDTLPPPQSSPEGGEPTAASF